LLFDIRVEQTSKFLVDNHYTIWKRWVTIIRFQGN
jgi:hypothetical protein